MRKTTAMAVALAACATTQLFAQNAKEDTITFALTARGQSSVSQTTAPNAGSWVNPTTGFAPFYYKTTSKKLTQVDIIKAIGVVLKKSYSSQAKLVLVQGELSGFFNLNNALANSTENRRVPTVADPRDLDGTFTDLTGDVETGIGNAQNATYTQLATGRHFLVSPINGAFPPGHHQPWGQIFIKDPTKLLPCDNVTFFFRFTVEECYDCFYLNSFITDTTFRSKSGTQSGPPCCNIDTSLLGTGKDQYYMTMTFDNTPNNPSLNPASGEFVGFTGLVPPAPFTALDGSTPDGLPFDPLISSGFGRPSPYLTRFVLNGIVSYNWTLTFVNPGFDLLPDFVGNASYAANGYGFIGLVCQLITGTANFSERIVKASTCCLDIPWYNNWYATGFRATAAGSPTPFNEQPGLTQHNYDGVNGW